jgi:hypothetical protein
VRITLPLQYENKRGTEITVIKMSTACLKTSFYGISASHLFVRVRDLRIGIRFTWLKAHAVADRQLLMCNMLISGFCLWWGISVKILFIIRWEDIIKMDFNPYCTCMTMW